MAEYIEREKLIRRLQKVSTEAWKMKLTARVEFIWNEAIDIAKRVPAADVVPVVRCKDCIHLSNVSNGGSFFRCDRYDQWQDEQNRVYMPKNGFCFYGQKGKI